MLALIDVNFVCSIYKMNINTIKLDLKNQKDKMEYKYEFIFSKLSML